MEKTLQELINAFIHKNNKDLLFLEGRVPELWHSIAGNFISSKTKSVVVQQGTLYVSLTNASLRFELNARRSDLRKRLNEALGMEIIKEIVFF
ncbi:MAG: DUF721 domain-containing protein [Bacteroidales bacterium]|jgi:predicted nucleic acid-binding Zn ribbon protein|nr:DUF721 domain-containing protein [Bacteroidales bacterium]